MIAIREISVLKYEEITTFLGMTGYFRKFIKNYVEVTEPLSAQLKKEVKFRITLKIKGSCERR